MTEESFFDKIKTKLTRQGDVVSNETLYTRKTDPQSDAIAKAEQRALSWEQEAQRKQTQVDTLTRQITEIKKRANALPNKTSESYKQLAQQGSRLLMQRNALAQEAEQARKRHDNFKFAAGNLKRQKQEEDDAALLKELNLRMALGQEKLDVGELKEVMGAARHANREVAQTTGILSDTLDADAASPESMLNEFEAFGLDDTFDELDALPPLASTTTASTTRNNTNSVLSEY